MEVERDLARLRSGGIDLQRTMFSTLRNYLQLVGSLTTQVEKASSDGLFLSV